MTGRLGRPSKYHDGSMWIRLPYKRRRGERAIFARIDPEDWRLAAIPWRAMRTSPTKFYAACIVRVGDRKQRTIYLHREVLRAVIGDLGVLEVDHIDGDTLDCRRSNLRIATHQQNARNVGRKRSNTSGYKGVSRAPSGRWRSYIVVDARQISLGTFDDADQAGAAYDGAAMSIFGEFARTNGVRPSR